MPLKILIVEDNPMDAELVKMALKGEGIEFAAEIVRDGDAAVDRLCPGEEHNEPSRPDLIVLDLNLPKRNGTEVLQIIRTEKHLTHVTVVVLSSSPRFVIEETVTAAKVEADCYFTKPSVLREFLALGKAFRECYEAKQKTRMDAS